jgi:hypothetical protein
MKTMLLVFVVLLPLAIVAGRSEVGQSPQELAKQYLPPHATLQPIKSYNPSTGSTTQLETGILGHLRDGNGEFLTLVYTPEGSQDLILRVVTNPRGNASIAEKKLPGAFLWMQDNITNGLQVFDINGDGADEVIAISGEGASTGAYLEVFSVAPGKLTNIVQGRYEAIGGYRFDFDRQPDGKYRIIALGKWTEPDNSTVDAYAWDGTRYVRNNSGLQKYYSAQTNKLLQEVYSNQPVPAPQRANVVWQLVPLYLKQHRYQESIKLCNDVLKILTTPSLVTIPESAISQARTVEQKQRMKADWGASGLEAQALVHRMLGDTYKAAGNEAGAEKQYSQDERLRSQAKDLRASS